MESRANTLTRLSVIPMLRGVEIASWSRLIRGCPTIERVTLTSPLNCGSFSSSRPTIAARLITFRDCRPQAQARPTEHQDAARVSGLITPRILVTMQEVAEHEARHAAVALFFGFNVIEARADAPAGKALGHVLFDHSGEQPWDRLRYAAALVTLVAGGLGEKGWPPVWPLDPNGGEDDEDPDV